MFRGFSVQSMGKSFLTSKIVPSFAALKTKIEKNDEFSGNKQATRSY